MESKGEQKEATPHLMAGITFKALQDAGIGARRLTSKGTVTGSGSES
jgi:hypothetical protein